MRYLLGCLLFISLTINAQSGTLLVLNKSDDTVDFVNLADDNRIITLPTGDGPHEVAVSPDEKIAIITNYGRKYWPGSSLTVIDIPGKKVVKTITLEFKAPHGIEFIDADRLLVTCEESKKLILVNWKTGKTEGTIDTKQNTSHMVAYSSKYQRAFVTNIRSGSISVINIKTQMLEKIIPTGEGAEGVSLSADQSEVWITNRAQNTITILDTKTLQTKTTLTSEEFPIRAKATTDGNYVLISNAKTGDITVFDARTKKLLKTISMEITVKEKESARLFQDFDNSPVPVGILILPDNSKAFIANTNADVLTVIDLKKLEISKRIPTGKEPDGLGYSSLKLK